MSLPATGPGPLDGVTVAVKDMFAVAGHVSSFGHPRWRATHPPSAETAPAVSRLLAAGASVAGLAKLDQLAYSLIGNAGEGTAPLNSRYPGRFTGGSSSGPAAAVAAGLAGLGLGTDTAGSIRVPAASCGLFGFRPSHGLVGARGVLPLAPSFDVVGILARSAAMLGPVLEVLASPGVARPPAAARTVHVAGGLAGISPELADAVQATAAAIADRWGCGVSETPLDAFINDDVADLFARVQGREVWRAHRSWLAGNRQFLADDVQARVQRAEALSQPGDPRRQEDERAWRGYAPRLDRVLPPGSVAVLPVTPGLPPLRDAGPRGPSRVPGRRLPVHRPGQPGRPPGTGRPGPSPLQRPALRRGRARAAVR